MRAVGRLRLTGAAVVALLLAACSGGSAGTSDASEGPVTLSYWAWVPEIDQAVDLWNSEHPDIQVEVTTPASSDELMTKIITAAKAGEGPDLMQAEYQALPTLVTNGVAADITELTAGVDDAFTEATWDQVTFGGVRYAVPQDVAPMLLVYRADLFEQYGLTVPTTWDEFAAVAEKLHAEHPDVWLTTFSATDPGWFSGLAAQAGSQWWSYDGEAWSVGIDDAASVKVADYWEGLVDSGAVLDDPMYTTEWNTKLTDGSIIAWPSAVWAPGTLESVAAGTAGQWQVAALPQWDASSPVTGNWGGSTTAVGAGSDHVEEATEFAVWLNTDPAALELLASASGVYPAASARSDLTALASPPAFFSNQTDYYTVADEAASVAQGFTWGPNVNTAYTAYEDAFGAAVENGTSFADALAAMASTTSSDLADTGFTVK